MTKLAELKKQWMQDADTREAYEAHAYEFEIARSLIEARSDAGLTQAEVAKRMGTTQSAIARIEGGSQLPSMKSVIRYATAIGARPVLQLVRGIRETRPDNHL